MTKRSSLVFHVQGAVKSPKLNEIDQFLLYIEAYLSAINDVTTTIEIFQEFQKLNNSHPLKTKN